MNTRASGLTQLSHHLAFESERKKIMIFTKFLIFLILNSPLMVKAIIGGQNVNEPHEFPWIVQITSVFDG